MSRNPRSFLCFFIPLLPMALGLQLVRAQSPEDSLHYYYRSIVNPVSQSDMANGLSFYTRRIETVIAQKDTLELLQCLRMVAMGEFKLGNPYESEATAVEGLKIINAHPKKDTLTDVRIGLLNQLGIVYRSLDNSGAALDTYEEALSISRKPADQITLLNNRANIYKDLAQYDNALADYRRIYLLTSESDNPLQYALVLDNIGHVMARQQNPAALDTLMKALHIRENADALTGLYASYKNLSAYYEGRNEPAPAQSYALKAYEVARRLQSPSYRYDALPMLLKWEGGTFAEEYSRMTDSMATAAQMAQNKYAFIKYNLEQERQRTAEQALQKEKETRNKRLFQLSTAFILIILILSFFIFRYRYHKGRQEEMYLTEARISKKVHDELANEVFNTMTFAQYHPLEHSEEKEKLLSALDNVYRKTRDISRDSADIPTGADYGTRLKELLAGFSSEKVNVIIKDLDSIPWQRIGKHKKMALYRVLQELLVNMKKHSGATLALITFLNKANKIHVQYSDNGKGMEADNHLNRGGLRIAENRIGAIKGSFTLDSRSNQGFRCTFSFPV